MRRRLLTAAACVALLALAGCGAADESDHTPDAVSYGSPVSQPSFGRLVAAVRKDTGSTRVVSLTGEVKGYGAYDVEVAGDEPRHLSYHYTFATLERDASSPAYVADDTPTFDLAALDIAAVEKIHHRAWDDADRRIAGTELTITGRDAPAGPTVHVVVTGVDGSTYVVDADAEGTILSEAEGPAAG